MPDALFVYGTLENPRLLMALTGKRFRGMEARLPGYRCMRVRGADYPGIIPDADQETRGTLYLSLDHRSLRRLDRYEGKLYRRIRVRVLDQEQRVWPAYVYAVPGTKRQQLSPHPWRRLAVKNRGDHPPVSVHTKD